MKPPEASYKGNTTREVYRFVPGGYDKPGLSSQMYLLAKRCEFRPPKKGERYIGNSGDIELTAHYDWTEPRFIVGQKVSCWIPCAISRTK